MEFSKDSNKNSDKEGTDWGIMFSQLMKNYPALDIEKINNLSYPQFKILYREIYNPKTFSITIPYMGSGDKNKEKTDEIKQEENQVQTKEGILQTIARMNSGWK